METSLDRESVSQYTLTVMATDQGGLFCSAQLYVTVTDVNDNAPMFTQNEYTVTVPEDAPLNTLLTRVTATDADLGKNKNYKSQWATPIVQTQSTVTAYFKSEQSLYFDFARHSL